MDYKKAYAEAKAEGYSDEEIAQHLSGDSAKYKEAVDNGYTPAEIISHFTGETASTLPDEPLISKAVNKITPVVEGVGQALKDQLPQAREISTLGMSSAPQMAERISNFVQKKPNSPAQTLLQMASNRPDVTAQVVASMIPGVGMAPSIARVAGATGAGMMSQENKGTNGAFAGGIQAVFEALPYGVGKAASLFNVGKAVPGAGRQLGVEAAQEAGIQLTRPEITGGKISAGIQSQLEKTFSGGRVFNTIKDQGDEALNNFKQMFKTQYGTSMQPSEVGKVAKSGIESTVQTLKSQAQEIYGTLPNVKARPAELRNAAESLMREQLELPRPNRDGHLLRMLSDYRKLGTKLEKKISSVTDDFGFTTTQTKYKRIEDPRSYPSTNALKRMSSDLGDAWRKSVKQGETIGNVGSRDAAVLSSAIQKDIKAVGELRGQLDQANKLYRQAKLLDKNPLVKRLRNAGPEEATQLVFNGKKLTNVTLAKAALGQNGYRAIKGAYFNQLMDHPQLSKQLDGMSQEYLTNVFDAAELQSLRKVAAIQQVRGAADKLQGMSGSARANTQAAQAKAVWGSLGVAGYGALTLNPAMVTAGLGGAASSYYGPKLASQAFVKYGTKGLDASSLIPKKVPTAIPSGLQAIRQYLLGQSQQPGR